MKRALEQILNARCYHFEEALWRPDHMDAWLNHIHGLQPMDWQWLYADYAATLDFPFCLYYKEMLQAFPDAKVILTVRDPERWFASISSMLTLIRALDWVVACIPYGRRVMAVARFHFWGSTSGRFGGDMSRANALRVYRDHVAEVKKTVPPDRLLVFDCSRDGWEALCQFLDVDLPPASQPFPHLNDGMATIKSLAWLHFWRLYSDHVVLGLVVLVVLLLLLLWPSEAVSAPRGGALAANLKSFASVPTKLRFPTRSRLVLDADGAQRLRLSPGSDELEPPNAEEHDAKIFVVGSAAGSRSARSQIVPRLFEDGFEFVSLAHPLVERTLEALMEAGRLGSGHLSGAHSGRLGGAGHSSDPAADSHRKIEQTLPTTIEDALAAQLQGWKPFRLASGSGYSAKCAGLVMRRGGLSGAALAGSGAGFDRVARRVHIDQDLAGDPLRARWLTWLFRIPGVELLNLWLPTDTLVRLQPLALMSTSTLDTRRDLARFRANSTRNAGGSGGSFASDRLAVLHSDGQAFFFKPHMTRGEGIVFPTGRTPHSAFALPAEAPLADLMHRLTAVHEQRADAHRELCAEGDTEALLTRACAERTWSQALCELADRAVAIRRDVCAADATSTGHSNPRQQPDELRYLASLLTRTSVEVRCVVLFPHLAAMPLLIAATLACAALRWRRAQGGARDADVGSKTK